MNKTKRKIFEASLKLFSEKGYDATSIEEITATVGVAKGTLYYHFSSKEEIFNFLVEEGMKLLINSIEIKISRCNNVLDKIKAVSLIQLKAVAKYENGRIVNIKRSVLAKISKVLEIPPVELVSDIEERPVETAHKLADWYLSVELKEDEDVKMLIENYQQLDQQKKEHLKQYVRFLLGQD